MLQPRHVNITDRSFENVAELKYLGTILTNQNSIQEEIKEDIEFGYSPEPFVLSSAV
jgi:hypothetical protein